MTPQMAGIAGAFLFAIGAVMALNVMGMATIFAMVVEGMEEEK